MDILSHGLWSKALFKGVNKKLGRPVHNSWWAMFWGMFPDLFAFIPLFIYLTIQRFRGINIPSPRPPQVSPEILSNPMFELTSQLYSLSHSMVIFFLVFGLIWLIRYIWGKRNAPPWILGGWLLHILIDIPTHTNEFYPTPFLWPLSDWRFPYGFSWGQPWFMVLDITGLVLVFWYLRKQRTA